MTTSRVFSTYVIVEPCVDVKDGTCVEVCPVDCIETTSEDNQFFIDPDLCIACEQCVLVCPVDAILLEHEVPEQWTSYIEKNAAFFRSDEKEKPTVTTEEAGRLVEAAVARASEIGVGLSVVVVDQAGNEVSSRHMDDASPEAATAALDRAYTAVMMERSSSQVTEQMAANLPERADAGRIVREAGGIPFGKPYVRGAIGVAGGTVDQDVQCARSGVIAL